MTLAVALTKEDVFRNSVVPKAGTSMATPVVAGLAAVVRQYFRQGFYAGASSSLQAAFGSRGFLPSAALIKATLINSAKPLTGSFCSADGYVKLPSLPSSVAQVYEGYGRVSLSDGLAIASLTPSLRLEVPGATAAAAAAADNDSGELVLQEPSLEATGDEHRYCFEAVMNASAAFFLPIQATLVWTDPPASPIASQYVCHDLDLSLTAPFTGHRLLGNNDDADYPVQHRDALNNVEKIRVVPRLYGQPFQDVGGIGGDVDEFGCRPSAGEVFCEAEERCVIPWLEGSGSACFNITEAPSDLNLNLLNFSVTVSAAYLPYGAQSYSLVGLVRFAGWARRRFRGFWPAF